MLEIKREHAFGRSYRILLDGAPVARWSARAWKSGGRIELAGETLDLRATKRGRTFEMLAGNQVRASAERTGRQWHITGEGGEYELPRPSLLRGQRHQQLVRGKQSLGEFRRGRFGNGLTAELAEVPPSLQIFASLVVLALWQRRDATTVAAAGASGG